MTSPPIPEAEPHIRALLEQLRDVLPATVTVAVGRAPTDAAPPYLVAYPDPGDVQSARLAGQRERITIYVTVHAIGTGPEQASWCSDRAREVLLGAPPVVDGRHVYRLVQTPGMPPVSRDDDISPPLYLQVTEYELRSDPAA